MGRRLYCGCGMMFILLISYQKRVQAHRTKELSVRGSRRGLSIILGDALRKGKKHDKESWMETNFPTPLPALESTVYSNHPVVSSSPTSFPTPSPLVQTSQPETPSPNESTTTPSQAMDEVLGTGEPCQELTQLDRACQAIAAGSEFVTPFHMEVVYYYEISSYQEDPIDVVNGLGDEIRQHLATALVNCNESVENGPGSRRQPQAVGVGNGIVDSLVMDIPCVVLQPSRGAFCSIAEGSLVIYLVDDLSEVRNAALGLAFTELSNVFNEATFAWAKPDVSIHYIGDNLSEYRSSHDEEEVDNIHRSDETRKGFKETLPGLWISAVACIGIICILFFTIGRWRMTTWAVNSKGIQLGDDGGDVFSLNGLGGSSIDEAWWTGQGNLSSIQTMESTIALSSRQSSPASNLPAQFVVDDRSAATGTNEIIRELEKAQAARLLVTPATPSFIPVGEFNDEGLEVFVGSLEETQVRRYSVEDTVMF